MSSPTHDKIDLRFHYDGSVLKDHEMAADVDMENDDIIDCYHDSSQSSCRSMVE